MCKKFNTKIRGERTYPGSWHGKGMAEYPPNQWYFNLNRVMFGVLVSEQGCLTQFKTKAGYYRITILDAETAPKIFGFGWE